MSEYCENCHKLQKQLDELEKLMRLDAVFQLAKENDKLKAQYDKVVEQNKQLQAELREKTTECEELKNKLNNEKIAYETAVETFNQTRLDLQEEYEDILDSRQREWEEENERYIQALDEIEMICEAQDLEANWTALEILDLIKKAKDGEE